MDLKKFASNAETLLGRAVQVKMRKHNLFKDSKEGRKDLTCLYWLESLKGCNLFILVGKLKGL